MLVQIKPFPLHYLEDLTVDPTPSIIIIITLKPSLPSNSPRPYIKHFQPQTLFHPRVLRTKNRQQFG